MKDKRPVRILLVYKPGKEHAGHVDGWVIHPDDRVVREIKINKEKAKK